MSTLLVAVVCVLSGLVGSTRIKRDDCGTVSRRFQECNQGAYKDYAASLTAGDDGRPDWQARKTCNYMTASMEDCANILIGCNTAEEVNMMKDRQLEGILSQLESSLKEW